MKIHLVIANKNSGAEQKFLVKSHTRAGAENFVRGKFKPDVTASVPTQQELVDALGAGIPIEDATAPAASGDTSSDDQEQAP